MEQILFLLFLFKSTRKGRLCVVLFSGDVVFSCITECFLAYVLICNDGGPMKRCLGTFVAKLHN